MINISLSIDLLKNNFKNVFCKAVTLSKHKAAEFEVYRGSSTLISFDFSLSFTGRDHAGLETSIGLFGCVASLRIYDCRHWDYENNKWVEYPDAAK